MVITGLQSTHIKHADYIIETQELTIEFTDDSKYVYYDIPFNIINGWINSLSKGKYFLKYIKSSYEFKKIL